MPVLPNMLLLIFGKLNITMIHNNTCRSKIKKYNPIHHSLQSPFNLSVTVPICFTEIKPRHCLHEHLCPREYEHRTRGSGWKRPLRFTESSL